jgi:6-phosphogluconolactonase (cycloisomerase 2 family)
MKGFGFPRILGPILCTALASAASATTPVVTVTSPTNNSQDSSPVHFVATASSPQCPQGIAAMRIYTAPYVSVYTVDSDQINTDLTLQPGSYVTVVQAWDNCGGVGKTDVDITVSNNAIQPVRFAYTDDVANQNIWGYNVNPTTGALTLNGQGAVSMSNPPYFMASDKGGYRLYVTSLDSESSQGYLYGFFINRDNGYISPVPGSPVSVENAWTVAVHPSGDFVFVTEGAQPTGNGVYVFKVNSNGSLTPVAGSPFTGQDFIGWIAVDPSGKYLYGVGSNSVTAFAIDVTSGALTPLPGSPYSISTGSCSADADSVIDPFGYFVYTGDATAGDVSGFAIEASTGTLTSAAGSPYPVNGGCTSNPYATDRPVAIAIEATGRYLYVANSTNGPDISIFSINAGNGALTFVADTSSEPGGYCGASTLRPDPSGNFLYSFSPAPDNLCTGPTPPQTSVIGLSINHSTGALTPVPGSPYAIPLGTGTDEPSGYDIAVTP